MGPSILTLPTAPPYKLHKYCLWPENDKDIVAFFWSPGIDAMHNKANPDNNVGE